MRWFIYALLSFTLLCLSGCGFEPLYAERTGASNVPAALQNVAIKPLKDRNGQLLQGALARRLNPTGETLGDAPYLLDISMRQSFQFIGIREDAAPTRQRLRMTADYVLRNMQTDTEMFVGTALADTTIDIVDSEYATFIAEENASQRNAQVVAERILSRLALYFRARAEADAGTQ